MSMFCVERRQGSFSPRFEAWWRAAMTAAKGTKFEPYILNLFKEGNRWLVLEDGFKQALTFFSSLEGWKGSDDEGTPLTFRKLTVAEEHYATRNSSAVERAKFESECTCPINLPRRVRREADRASKKLIEKKIKAAARNQ